MSRIPEDRVDQRSQITRNRMNERPHLKTGLSVIDLEKFKERIRVAEVVPKTKGRNVLKRNPFEFGSR